MSCRSLVMVGLVATSVAGCASTDAEVTRSSNAKSLPFPQSILVYDFAVAPSEVSGDSAVAGRLSSAVDDPNSNAGRERLEHEIAGIVADKLVAELQNLGLPARRWSGPAPQMSVGY